VTTATGASGFASAAAGASLTPGSLVQNVSADATDDVAGKTVASSAATIGGSQAAFVTTGQAVALVTGAPSAATTSAILAANSSIKTAFGSSPVFFAVGELGGSYTAAGSGTETSTSTIDETIDLTKLSSVKDLVIGLYDGHVSDSSDVSSIVLSVDADGHTFTESATGATAVALFTDKGFNLGSMASYGNTLDLSVSLEVTTTSAGAGFYGDVIVGDPPPAGSGATKAAASNTASHAASTLMAAAHPAATTAIHPSVAASASSLVQAMATFGVDPGGASGLRDSQLGGTALSGLDLYAVTPGSARFGHATMSSALA
jgi:hypothetical protein